MAYAVLEFDIVQSIDCKCVHQKVFVIVGNALHRNALHQTAYCFARCFVQYGDFCTVLRSPIPQLFSYQRLAKSRIEPRESVSV